MLYVLYVLFVRYYTGNVMTNFFIEIFAPDRHKLFFSSSGALFQALILSFMKVSFVTLEKAVEFIFPALRALDTLSSSSTTGYDDNIGPISQPMHLLTLIFSNSVFTNVYSLTTLFCFPITNSEIVI